MLRQGGLLLKCKEYARLHQCRRLNGRERERDTSILIEVVFNVPVSSFRGRTP